MSSTDSPKLHELWRRIACFGPTLATLAAALKFILVNPTLSTPQTNISSTPHNTTCAPVAGNGMKKLNMLTSTNTWFAEYPMGDIDIQETIMTPNADYETPLAIGLAVRNQQGIVMQRGIITQDTNMPDLSIDRIETCIYPLPLSRLSTLNRVAKGACASGPISMRIAGLFEESTNGFPWLGAWVVDPTVSPPTIVAFGFEAEIDVRTSSSVSSQV